MKADVFIRCNYSETGTRSFSVYFGPDESPLCVLPTLRQASLLCRYLTGGNMNRSEREAVLVSLDVEASAFRKAQRSRRKSEMNAALS